MATETVRKPSMKIRRKNGWYREDKEDFHTMLMWDVVLAVVIVALGAAILLKI